ncbi:MAG TPA: DUF3717 domain-containing protein [Noviherbaspirillum sp.]|uniref:DUF3717 domain-containing protein n=1 Tax=Noviherbaspirillum sp. TaxID=1926288 RepID=UPI002DDD3AB4|nr:DUF3717 domain-containing protein [Noviherbaspirillum sp.]HEV2612099.1 DUF3717 domain-containing protein [Noviherbaspirillum sp.]
MNIHLTDLEQAINFWRSRRPSTGEERALSREVDTLATLYALMIFHRVKSVPVEQIEEDARALIDAWRKAGA